MITFWRVPEKKQDLLLAAFGRSRLEAHKTPRKTFANFTMPVVDFVHANSYRAVFKRRGKSLTVFLGGLFLRPEGIKVSLFYFLMPSSEREECIECYQRWGEPYGSRKACPLLGYNFSYFVSKVRSLPGRSQLVLSQCLKGILIF